MISSCDRDVGLKGVIRCGTPNKKESNLKVKKYTSNRWHIIGGGEKIDKLVVPTG